MADDKPEDRPVTSRSGSRYSFTGNIKVEMAVPPNLGLTYSDFVTVQSTGYEYVISFFQIDIPMLDPGDLETFEKDPRLGARCIARMALPLHAGDMLLGGLQAQRQRLASDGIITEGQPPADDKKK